MPLTLISRDSSELWLSIVGVAVTATLMMDAVNGSGQRRIPHTIVIFIVQVRPPVNTAAHIFAELCELGWIRRLRLASFG